MIVVMVLAPTLAVRAGLEALLGSGDQLAVVAEAASFDEVSTLPTELDVIVAMAEALAAPGLEDFLQANEQPALLLLTDEPGEAAGLDQLPLRAWGLLPLDASEDELLAAVYALHEGLLVGARQLMEPRLGQPLSAAAGQEALVEDLTARENEVLQLLAQGLANKQIALELDISEHTVKFHISSIYQKLGAANRTEAVRLGARLGLIVF